MRTAQITKPHKRQPGGWRLCSLCDLVGSHLSLQQQRDIGGTILALVNNAEAVLATINPPTISQSRRKEMVEKLKAMWAADVPEEDKVRIEELRKFFGPLKDELKDELRKRAMG